MEVFEGPTESFLIQQLETAEAFTKCDIGSEMWSQVAYSSHQLLELRGFLI